MATSGLQCWYIDSDIHLLQSQQCQGQSGTDTFTFGQMYLDIAASVFSHLIDTRKVFEHFRGTESSYFL